MLKARLGLAVAMAAMVVACGGKSAAPQNNGQPDRFLMDRGNEAMGKRDWLKAREYYRQIVDNYPQSPLRPDAKLGIGESFLGEGSTESLVLSANEFREFLTFYPTNPKADQAQYKLAMTYVKQMKAPARDQSATKEALKEFQGFFDRFPNSQLAPEVKKQWREARDRLSEASYLVGFHYYRQKLVSRRSGSFPGSLERRSRVLQARRRLLLPGRVAGAELEAGRSRALLRARADRVPTERTHRRRKKASCRAESRRQVARGRPR